MRYYMYWLQRKTYVDIKECLYEVSCTTFFECKFNILEKNGNIACFIIHIVFHSPIEECQQYLWICAICLNV